MRKISFGLTVTFGLAIAPLAHAAVIPVNTTTDVINANDGVCSLREAIIAANKNTASGAGAGECPAGAGNTDTISIPAGTYVLAIANVDANDEDDAATGDLDILNPVTISGAGQSTTIIDANGLDRIFHNRAPGTVTIVDLTVQGGKTNGLGGGILHVKEEPFTLTRVTAQNNAAFAGGGMWVRGGPIALNTVFVTKNAASQGGGMVNQGNTTITDSQMIANSASLGSGLFQRKDFSTATTIEIVSSTVQNNTGSAALSIDSNTEVKISKSMIVNNDAGLNGALNVLCSIDKSTIAHNKGTGLGVNSPTTITNSAIANNEGDGLLASIDTGSLGISNTTIANNTGHGVSILPGAGANGIMFYNTTISGNSHSGIIAPGISVGIKNSLLVGNGDGATTADLAGTSQSNMSVFSSKTNIFGSMIHTTVSLSGNPDYMDQMDLTAAMVLGAYVDSNDAGGSHFPLTSASPAINKGDPLLCTVDNKTDTDQLGNARVGTCDIGAIEAYCGDGFAQSTNGEQCDVGAQNIDTGACTATCQVAICGDSKVQAGVETCDDGNQDNNDGCPSTCQSPKCGDALVETDLGETCDDANAVNTDSCLNSCALAKCGDGIVQTGAEACDDGNAINTDACLNTCAAAKCGDGFVQTDVEECDGSSDCSTTCKTVPTPTGATEATAPATTTGDTTTTTDTTGTTTPTAASSGGGCSLIIH